MGYIKNIFVFLILNIMLYMIDNYRRKFFFREKHVKAWFEWLK